MYEIFFFSAIIGYLVYRWARSNCNIFKERGVIYESPTPFIGNLKGVVNNKISLMKCMADFYMRNKTHKVCGFFNFRNAVFVVNDPEAIKKIMIKDFEFFPNHFPFIPNTKEPLLEATLTVMKDQRWKNMRQTITPVFTSAKMRAMFPLMLDSFNETIKYMDSMSVNGEGFDIDLKDCMNRLSNDIIASTAFGMQINSFKNKENDFYKIGQSVTNFRGVQMFKFFLFTTIPYVLNFLGIKLFSQYMINYFMNIVMDTMKYREKNNVYRADMIQLMMEALKDSAHKWTNEEIVAQCFVFLFAAFENNANLVCLVCNDLLNHPDLQERLYKEIEETNRELDGKPLTYDALNKMKYLDMVVSETLRLWTPAAFTDRVCSKDYNLTDEDGNVIFKFKTNDKVWIPIIGLHRDPEYFENPETFNPERFSDENKDKIKPYTYLPFGTGPRSCIGNRHALMQAKGALFYLILKYKIERSSKTCQDLWEDLTGFLMSPKQGFWMHFVPRK